MKRSQPLQRLVQLREILFPVKGRRGVDSGGDGGQVVHLGVGDVATALDRGAPASVIDQMTPHLNGHQLKEGFARRGVNRATVEQAHERLVHELCRLQRVLVAFAAHDATSGPPKLLIAGIKEPVQDLLVAARPLLQQSREFLFCPRHGVDLNGNVRPVWYTISPSESIVGVDTTRRAEWVRDVFLAALDQPSPAREAYVRQMCADDVDAAREVLELLELHEQITEVDADSEGGTDDLLGTRLGPYEVVRLLGAGGMGKVYLARRADSTFQREVAIKLVDGTKATAPDVLPRFERERSILASLRHPNIAMLFDAGLTSAGRMYFIMEYVDGLRLTDHCEHHRLGLRPRIELFLRVCGGVSYAHRNLIIHRDLKPANILVDAEGQPKILDFGIAKVVSRAQVDLHPTEPWLKRATPAYASPEHLSGGPAHTAMDVYALGVVLYQLLTGSLPQRATGDETRTGADAVASQALARHATSKGLPIAPQELAGDLDAILSEALAAVPSRRYESVDALADDLRAWAAIRPVQARNGGAWYRAQKFARRNAVASAAATIALLSLIAAVAVFAQLWLVTGAERDRVERQFSAARVLAQSMLDIDERLSGINGSTAVRRVLVDTLASYLAAAQIGADRQLLLDTAGAYKKLGDIEGNPNGPNLGSPTRALTHYDNAMRILTNLSGRADDDELHAILAETRASRADVYTAQAQFDRAEAEYGEALTMATQLVQRYPTEWRYQELLAGIYRPLGDIRLARGDVAGALVEYERAQVIDESTASTSPDRQRANRLAALTRIRIGDANLAAGNLSAAHAHYDAATRILLELADDSRRRRDLLRDAALGFARLGSTVSALRTKGENGGMELQRAVDMLRELVATDPSDERARRDLMVTLTQYSDALAVIDPGKARAALSEARQMARRFSAQAPGDVERTRELSAIEQRLAKGAESGSVALQLYTAGGAIQPGGEPVRLGTAIRAQATAPAGWTRYLLVFGAEGPAEIFDEGTMQSAKWTVPVRGPVPAQTVLLVASPRALSPDERRRLTDSVESVVGPRIIDFDSHVVWADRSDRIESTASARGVRDTRWVQDVRARIAAIGSIRFTGRTFPVALPPS